MTITASVARQTLPAQLDRVEAGEEVEITRHGKVVAVLVAPAALRLRRASEASGIAESVQAMLDRARSERLGRVRIGPERAEELAAGVRAAREARG